MSDERRPLFGLYFGEVTRRDDPENRCRVRYHIPGLTGAESADWALPLGVPGAGTAQSGGPFHPPPVGANVGILFEQGDPDKPTYLPGPWGAPGGATDAPTNSEVEGDDRQKAMTEDQEWLIERDSTGEGIDGYVQKWRVTHKSSGAEIVVRSDDKVHLVRDGATEALVIGTSYRSSEVTALGDLVTAMNSIVLALAAFSIDPAFAAAFPAAAAILNTMATTTYPNLRNVFTGSAYASDATDGLSEKAFTG
jgi:hypothetical protein